MELITGTKYEIILKNKDTRTGIIVSTDKDSAYIKLDSGYNEGILLENIENTKKISEPKKNKKEKFQKEENPEILILHTGGTIASKVDYETGAVNSLVTPEEILSLYPELKNIAKIGSELISNMPSDDMNFSHYNIITKKIEESIKKYPELKGIILTHGTDTLHYTSAALSFTLQNLPIPIIMVGSQRSSDRPSSDAASNLLNAALFIKQKPRYKQVMICMHQTLNDPECLIINGVNARKMHSSKRDAFEPINTQPIARVNYENKEIKIIQEPNTNEEKLKITKFKENLKIGWIKSRPGMIPEEFNAYKNFDAVILEGTGLGHFPITEFDENTKINKEIFGKIKELSQKTIMIMTTQTIKGRVNMNVYSPGRKLKELGILGHESAMTPETAYIKTAFLLSNHKNEIKELYNKDFVGENNKRIIGEEK